MSAENVCAVLYGPEDIRMENRPVPTPTAGEVQVQVRCVGICGSDAAVYRGGNRGPITVTDPLVLGHEASGVVTAVGDGVSTLAVGDRVAMDNLRSCGRCGWCVEGRKNMCGDSASMANPGVDGPLAHFFVWPAGNCHKMPPTMSWEEGALVQPVALALYGCQRAGVKPGHRVLVTGAGPLGMSMVLMAQALGAGGVCVTDICDERLQFLVGVSGCSAVLVKDSSPKDTAQSVTSSLGTCPDVSIECSGSPHAVNTAIYATGKGGCVLLAGFGGKETSVCLLEVQRKELDVRSMYRFSYMYPAAMELMSSGRLDPRPIVAHRYPLSQAARAFQAMESKVKGKIMVVCSTD